MASTVGVSDVVVTTTIMVIMKNIIIIIMIISALLPDVLGTIKGIQTDISARGCTRDSLGIWGRKGDLYIVAGLLLLILVVMSH